MLRENNDTSSDSIIWTLISPNSKLNEIEGIIEGNLWKEWIKKLSKFLEQQDYIWFQKEIGLTWNDVDGKLWMKTYNRLQEYIWSTNSRNSLVDVLKTSKDNEIERTEKSPKSKLKEIVEILEKNKWAKKINELLLLVQGKKYKDLQKNIWMSDKDCDGKLWEKTLIYLKKHIDTIWVWAWKVMIENGSDRAWKIILENDKDRTWKYKVYSYVVKTWGQPKHIRSEYVKQIWWEIEWIKITDDKWVEYNENTNFKPNDKVFIKVPLERLDNISEDIREKIKMQEDYIEWQKNSHKVILEKFNRESPMWKDVEISFWIPVDKYEDIDKTLASITTNQTIDPKRYEVVVLLNRPNNKIEFHKKTKEKILRFKAEHPEYNINIFEHTFNFGKETNMWEIYKLLWDTLIYRNIQRKNIKWMDMKKIRNLIVKRWGSDSTEKHPDYLKHQIEKYNQNFDGKELVRLAWESRIWAELAQTYPLIEIDEFFQRYYDLEFVHGDPLQRDVWLWSCKAWCYCAVWWTPSTKVQEDTSFVSKIRDYVNKHKNDYCMYYDNNFIWATDNSTDRGICSMVHWIPYCRKYTWSFKEWDKTKDIEWNTWAIRNKGKKETENLELTTKNLERDISALYQQRLYFAKERSLNYKKYINTHEWKLATTKTRDKRVLSHVVNPIMERVLSRSDFMWLDKNDYSLFVDSEWNPQIKFKESAIEKIKRIQQKKIRDWYYDYRK